MIKTILKLLVKVLESKLVKAGIEEQLLKYKNYIEVGKSIWKMLDENWRISENVENKLESKAAEFDKALLIKFPELTQRDVQELRQSIAGEINSGKDAVLSQSEVLRQLQESNAKLQAENIELKNKFNSISSFIPAQEQ